MSIAALVETLLAAGVDHATIVAAVEAVEKREPARTARQERNARYYEANKERLKASENRLKTSYSPLDKEIPPTPPKEINPPLPPSSLRSDGGSAHENFPLPEKPKKRASRFPDEFEPNEAGLAAADRAGMGEQQLGREIERFRNYHTAKGSLMVDWQAAWRTWCGNYRPAQARAGPPQRGSAALSAALRELDNDEFTHDQAISGRPLFRLSGFR